MVPGDIASAIELYASHFGRDKAAVLADLESFSALLLKWNATQNLVSRETVDAVWERHILDSLQLLPHLPPRPEHKSWLLDVGSGGGMPALPLAMALKGTGTHIQLVEPIGKKVVFLRTAIREFGLEAQVHAGRTDDFDSRETQFAAITSRALAPLPRLFHMIAPFFAPETVAVLHKGKDHAVEITESRLAWDFDVVVTNSVTDERGVVLEIRNLRLKSSR
jgi:16S rRNA (guanine527-N7)-methyltransferase